MKHSKQWRFLISRTLFPLLLALTLFFMGTVGTIDVSHANSVGSINTAFQQASRTYGVPLPVLQSLCYMEGRLSNHGGSPSVDGGYGCMHLVKNKRTDTLDHAAQELGVRVEQLKNDLSVNIRGGALLLREAALRLSPNHTLPAKLADWYGAVAQYSNATTRSTALMYADALYKILNTGFSAPADNGEIVTLAPQHVQPNTATAVAVKGSSNLPSGCSIDNKVDYPGAIDCILDPKIYDCTIVTQVGPCTYQDANRPYDFNITNVVIHDIEGTAQDALNVFQDPNSGVSVHYIVDSDGTVYQVVHEKDIAYHAGNFWYNEHSVGIEHAGFDATGWQWYNATEYLASAKLTAYLLQKYNIPLDRGHVVAHGTIPSPELIYAPNHVDPGPYWLWDYYFKLINQQGVPYPQGNYHQGIITLHPRTDQRPYNKNGTETPANFNFFYLYNGPSTASGLIPHESDGTDVTDVTDNVEPDISYYYLAKVKDPAGTGDTMYEIWYGVEDHLHDPTPSYYADAMLVWLAVPPNTAFEGQGTIVTLTSNSGNPQVSGKPVTGSTYYIGDAPNNSVFVSAYTAIEDDTNNLWYEIDYNHRQAWVPASEVSVLH